MSAIDRLASLSLQEPFFDMGYRGPPFLIRPTFHGLKESCLIRQIPGQDFLNQLIRIAALLGGAVHQLLLHIGGKMHFHLVGSFS